MYAISKFAKEIVELRDNLGRAMEETASASATAESGSERYNKLRGGVELTAKQLDSILKRHKIEVIDPQGEAFDPKLHDAMYEMPDKQQEDGKVAKVLRTGWKIGDRVLRAATVAVVKNSSQ